ncbi:MAG: protein kinase [Ktedonobacteraceae bacterium]|nr:protein kinase [Ktedonobacteraceae bacterium]
MKEVEQIEIGRYRVQSHLARGGMADVYLAHDSENDQVVALKMVHDSAGEYCERFQREVRVMAGLVHEHILPAFDYGEHESWYFLVTPYIEYGTLNGRLDAGPLTVEEVDPILAQLAEALQFAHEQGIIHRDIKPSNVLMRDGNHVYLADFGLVKRVGQENGLTVTGYLIGTPEYMAPELAEEDATPQSDVYSLGVLLYQMLAGRVPFKANTPMGVFLRHIRDNPEPPSTLNPAIPSEVEDVILHSMEKDPQRRYQSAQELYRAYQQAVKDAAIRRENIADRPTQISGNQPIRIDSANRVEVKIRKQRRKVKRPLLAVALIATLLLAGVFFLASAVFAPGGRGSSIHAADARDAKDRQTPTSTAKHVTPASLMDSAANKRPATGSTGGDVISPVSTTNLNQNSESSTLQQTTGTVSESSQGNDNAGGSGQGTTSNSENGSGSGGDQGAGNGGSGGSQSTSSGGSGQGTGSSGSGGGQSTGSGQGTGSGGDQGGGSDSGKGKGKGKGNANGQGNGKGKGDANGQGNGKGKGDGKGKGNGGGD